MSLQFNHNGSHYSIIYCSRTVDAGEYKVTVWNSKGQMTDVFYVYANSYKEAKDRAING